MYQYIEAIGTADGFDGRYYPIDIRNVRLIDVFATYSSVYVTLARPGDFAEVTLNLYDLPQGVRVISMTLPEWLIVNGNNTLPTTNAPVVKQYRHVQFFDLRQSDFTINPGNINYHPEMELPEDMLPDLVLSKPGAHYKNMVDYGLFTVNGYIHRADHTLNGVVVLDGCKSGKIANDTHVGILDFQHIGKLTIVDIDPSMLFSRIDGQKFEDVVYIKTPTPMLGKIPLLVVGGMLHALDGSYSAVSDNVIRFDFKNYPWVNRYNAMKSNIDVSTLGLEGMANGADSLNELYSDSTIQKLFGLKNSFIVLVDTHELHRGTVLLNQTKLPGIYLSGIAPSAPLMLGDGELAEYKITTEHGQYVLAIRDGLKERRLLETTDYLGHQSTGYKLETSRPYDYASARLLMLSRNVEL